MAVALFSGGSYNFSNSFNNLSNVSEKSTGPGSINQTTQVLGAQIDPLTNLLTQLISQVPTSIWIILSLEFVAFIILAIIISLINSSWSLGSLIQAIQTALDDKPPTIRDSSEKAFSTLKPLIWLQTIPMLIYLLAVFLAIFVLIGIYTAGGESTKVIIAILGVILGLVFIYGLIILSFTQIWATRVAILDKKSGRASLGAGYRLVKKKFWSMFLLGIVNTIMTLFIIAIPIGIIFGLLWAAFSLIKPDAILGAGLMVVRFILVIVFIFGLYLLSGLLTAFKASVWTIAFHKIKDKYGL